MPAEMREAWRNFFKKRAEEAKDEKDKNFFMSLAQFVEDYRDGEDS